MLSHDNISWTVLNVLSLYEVVPNMEVGVSYLPLNHIAAQIMELWMPMFAQVNYLATNTCIRKRTLIGLGIVNS